MCDVTQADASGLLLLWFSAMDKGPHPQHPTRKIPVVKWDFSSFFFQQWTEPSPRLGPPTSTLVSIDFSRNSGIIFPATFRTSRVEPRKPCSRCSKIQRNNCIFFDARKPVLPVLKLRAFPLRICTLCGNCRRKWCCSCNRCIDGDTCHNAFVSIAVSVATVVAAVSVATVMLAETDVS